ncbi:MAG: carbon-nitrogen hydrolase family protein [Gemmatimonadales bacterium]
MRVTVCELPHDPAALESAWAGLCAHTWREQSELVLLPELGMVEPLWEHEQFDPVRWARAELVGESWMALLGELHAQDVVGTRPWSVGGARYNEGFLWSPAGGVRPLRRKYFMPDEPGGWERRWFDRGDPVFPAFRAGPLSFGLNICTELWALETYAGYAEQGVELILSPRATGAGTRAKWLAAGTVAAVRSGAFSISSNRVEPSGACGGCGWIIAPSGEVLATTSAHSPFVTVDLDLTEAATAGDRYPGYVFRGAGA